MQSSKANTYAVAVCFTFVYALSYFATEVLPTPLLWYYPLENTWLYGGNPPPGLMMGWYGKVLLSLVLAALGSGLLWAGLRLTRREPGPNLLGLLDLAAISSVIFVLYYIARSLAYRVI